MFGSLTYLIFELAWALPVLVLHWIVGGSALRANWRILVLGTCLPSAYLTIADGVALHVGIWALHGNRIVGLRLANVPIEESIFFLLTNLMIVQTVLLFHSPQVKSAAARRVRAIVSRQLPDPSDERDGRLKLERSLETRAL